MSYSKSNYEFLKSRGICTKCGKNKAVNKTTYCEYCLEKDVIKNAKYREKNRHRLREESCLYELYTIYFIRYTSYYT